jgi:hypothetical protein
MRSAAFRRALNEKLKRKASQRRAGLKEIRPGSPLLLGIGSCLDAAGSDLSIE